MGRLLVLVAMLLMKHVSTKEVCSVKPVSVLFAIDWTVNVNVKQRHQMTQVIQAVIATIPDDSEGRFIYVNDKRNEVVAFVVENQGINITKVFEQNDWKPTGHSISATALEQQANVCFTVSDNKIKTEVFVLLVSDLTKLEGNSHVLLQEKTFVLVFGSRVQNKLKRLASSGDHIHLIKDEDDVTTAVNSFSKQLCKASSTRPVCMSVSIDRTVNVTEEQREKMANVIQHMAAIIPEGSEGHFIYVNYKNYEIATFVIENQNINFTNVHEQDLKPNGYSITEEALVQAAHMCPTSSGHDSKSEINILLVSDLTKLEGVPPLWLRKKTIVIVFGSSIPNELKSLGSSWDHTYLIKDSENVSAVVDLVSKKVCKDTGIHFLHISDGVDYPKETGSKKGAVHIVLVVLSIVGVVIIFCLILFVCLKLKLLCFASSGNYGTMEIGEIRIDS